MDFSLLLPPKRQHSSFPYAVVLLLLVHALPVPQSTVYTWNTPLCIREQGSQQVLVALLYVQSTDNKLSMEFSELGAVCATRQKRFFKYNCLQYLLPVSQTFCVLQGVSAETWGSETLARLKGDSGKGCLIKFDIWLFRKLMFEVPGWLVLLENVITVKDTPVKLNVSMKIQLPGNDYMCNIHFMCCFTSGICTSTHDAWSGT